MFVIVDSRGVVPTVVGALTHVVATRRRGELAVSSVASIGVTSVGGLRPGGLAALGGVRVDRR